MHEVDLAIDLVRLAAGAAAGAGDGRVASVRLAVGRLAGVDADSLVAAFGVATRGTPLDGARLEIRVLPVVLWCAVCLREVELEGVQSLRCPVCSTAAGEIRQGKELEIESIELESAEVGSSDVGRPTGPAYYTATATGE